MSLARLIAGLVLAALLGASALASGSAYAAGPNEFRPPDWWPLRGSNKVGCARNSPGAICGGNYHPVWAIDVEAPEGQAVYAAGAGLAKVNSNTTACSGYGRSVVVEHGGSSKSLYAHLSNFSSALNASPGGVWVDENSVIGYVGHTGNTSNCSYNHLHYEETTNGSFWSSATDPGGLKGCIGSSVVTYPNHWGYGTWNGLPAHSLTARHDGGCGGSNPIGAYDLASSPEPGVIRTAGWSFDGDARTTALQMHVYVGGQAGQAGAVGHAFVANGYRPDVNAAHPGVGDYHGLDQSFQTSKRGAQSVCLYAINVGGGSNVLLGCKTVAVADPNPFGNYDSLSSPEGGKIKITGWAIDPSDRTKSLETHIYIGGPAGTPGADFAAFPANASRPDVGKAFPGSGDSHGLDVTFATSKRGTQQVCLYAINIGVGDTNTGLGCKSVQIGDPPPPPPPAESTPEPTADAADPTPSATPVATTAPTVLETSKTGSSRSAVCSRAKRLLKKRVRARNLARSHARRVPTARNKRLAARAGQRVSSARRGVRRAC